MNAAPAIALLTAARALIDSDAEGFICLALEEVVTSGNHDLPADASAVGEQLCGYIASQLAGHPYLTYWTAEQLGICGDRIGHNTRQLCRLAWIDKMIDDLTNHGTLP